MEDRAISQNAILEYLGDTNMDIFTDEVKEFVLQLPSVTPCEDAINRAELLKAIDTWDKFGCDANTKLVPYQDHFIPYIHYDDVVKCIKGMPSVKPQEPKTGHWIGDKAYPICPKCNCNVIERYISCSDYAEMYKPMKYCPNCGAKMVEPQERSDKE